VGSQHSVELSEEKNDRVGHECDSDQVEEFSGEHPLEVVGHGEPLEQSPDKPESQKRDRHDGDVRKCLGQKRDSERQSPHGPGKARRLEDRQSQAQATTLQNAPLADHTIREQFVEEAHAGTDNDQVGRRTKLPRGVRGDG